MYSTANNMGASATFIISCRKDEICPQLLRPLFTRPAFVGGETWLSNGPFLGFTVGRQRCHVVILQHRNSNRASWAPHFKCIFHQAIILAWPQVLWVFVGCTVAAVIRKMAFLPNLVAKGRLFVLPSRIIKSSWSTCLALSLPHCPDLYLQLNLICL